MVRLPHDWENIQKSQLNPLLSSLPLSSLDTLIFSPSNTHTHTDKHVVHTPSLSLSLFQCSVKRVILSSFTYLREEFPALVMIRHRSSLIKQRKSSPKLTKDEILKECSFCKKPAGFRQKANYLKCFKEHHKLIVCQCSWTKLINVLVQRFKCISSLIVTVHILTYI